MTILQALQGSETPRCPPKPLQNLGNWAGLPGFSLNQPSPSWDPGFLNIKWRCWIGDLLRSSKLRDSGLVNTAVNGRTVTHTHSKCRCPPKTASQMAHGGTEDVALAGPPLWIQCLFSTGQCAGTIHLPLSLELMNFNRPLTLNPSLNSEALLIKSGPKKQTACPSESLTGWVSGRSFLLGGPGVNRLKDKTVISFLKTTMCFGEDLGDHLV